MSWVGNTLIGNKIRSLFHKEEQAPSITRFRSRAAVLSNKDLANLDRRVNAWVQDKAYRLPEHTMDAVASRMGVESAQLHKYCYVRFGMDFRTWRTALRIEDAKEQLIAEPEASVATIGRRVGFNDRGNFNKKFLEHTGHSPMEWRKLFG